MTLEIHTWLDELAPSEMSMDLMHPASVYSDPRSSRSIPQRRSNDYWTAQMTFRNLDRRKWKKLNAFLAKIEGPIGRVRLFDYSDPWPEGAAGFGFFSDGSIFDDGFTFEESDLFLAFDAAQGDDIVSVTLGADITVPLFREGDVFSLPNDRRHIVTEDTEVGLEGEAVDVHFNPPLYDNVIANDRVTVYRPTEIFRLVSRPETRRSTERLVNVELQFVQGTRV